MIHHCQAVKRGAPNRPLLIGDMPFGSYEYENVDIALKNAYRMVKEGGMDAVKFEVRNRVRVNVICRRPHDEQLNNVVARNNILSVGRKRITCKNSKTRRRRGCCGPWAHRIDASSNQCLGRIPGTRTNCVTCSFSC